MFLEIVLNIPSDKTFTYEVSAELERDVEIGKRVFVPFGHKKRTGFIIEKTSSCNIKNIKPILEVLDEEPLFSIRDLDFYRWISRYFLYPLGKTLAELIPSGSEKKDFLWITLRSGQPDTKLPAAEQKLLDFLKDHPRGVTIGHIAKLSGVKHVYSPIKQLQSMGFITIESKHGRQLSSLKETFVSLHDGNIVYGKLTDKQKIIINLIRESGEVSIKTLMEKTHASSEFIKRLREKGIVSFTQKEKTRTAAISSSISSPKNIIHLNNRQSQVLQEISRHLQQNRFSPILLHGVTGSGKTEIYLRAIEETLKKNASAIYLVPEIALTPQLVSRIAGRFDERRIAVLHSGISESVRFDQWRQIIRGEKNFVLGTRSALFAPLPDLKLIVVDEEHDVSYKQDERLCYNARDLAIMKAKLSDAVVMIGSATPSIQSYYNTQIKKYRRLELPQRVDDRPMPTVEIIDLKSQKETTGKIPIISNALAEAIRETLQRKEQTLLFLNKRGFETFLVCADCGYNFQCPNCAVSLKHHAADETVKCHYCGYTIKAMPLCPSCKNRRILSYGLGTQKLEKEIQKIFPNARVQRMDSDSTSRRGAQEKILYALEQRKIDILIGTQMITKGHDFPSVTLVGVVSADTSLNMPDFRAAEKTFQLITQVAGRGGRGDSPGRVIIQTFNPEHYALRHAQHHDYKSFYKEEIENRQALHYPPFGRIINLRLSSINRDALIEEAGRLRLIAQRLNKQNVGQVDIIGPAESPLAKIRGRYRWQMMIKGQDINLLHKIARDIIGKNQSKQVRITADIDPENFM